MVYRCAHDGERTMSLVSAGCEELTGYAPMSLIGNADVAYQGLIAAEHCEAIRQEIASAVDRAEAWTLNYPIVTATGDTTWVLKRGTAVRDDDGEVLALEGIITGVDTCHSAEERLTQAAAEWRQTFDAILDSVTVMDAEGKILRCNAAPGQGFEKLLGQHCFEAFHGPTASYPAPSCECPRQRALESRELETNVRVRDGRWLRETFHPILGAQARVTGGVHVVSDVTDLKQAEQQLVESVARQKAITSGVIAALVRAVEVRDPYTAGHQRRVSELAVAMAEWIDLGEERAQGLRVAGMLHDVGKITIPAEIITKPGRLSAIEFELIKGHPQAGFDVLAAIDFPWPWRR